MNLLNLMKKYLFKFAVGVLFFLLAQSCASALTISNNLRTISDTYYNYLENVALSSDYKHYVITSNYTSSNYSGYSTYYLCLTDEDVTSSYSSLSTSCDELITYYYTNSTYSYTITTNEELTLTNTLFYRDVDSSRDLRFYLCSLIFGTFLISMLTIFFRVLRNRYGGFRYEKVT